MMKKMSGSNQQLSARTKRCHKINHKSLRENNDRLRGALYGWAQQFIHLEEKEALESKTKKRNLPKQFNQVCLWFDSSDFHFNGKKSTSTKDNWWSYKLNSPGVN